MSRQDLFAGFVLFHLLTATFVGALNPYLPQRFVLGKSPSRDGLAAYTGQEVTLDSNNPVLTLDYGLEVGGLPYFETSALDGTVQVELKYSEPFAGLNNPMGDGPWLLNNPLANSFRTETFNVTGTGQSESFFQQGGLRWQSIILLSNSSITIRNIGLKATVDIKGIDGITGGFSCSNPMYDQVWNLGARAVEASCFEANSQPSTWEITSDGAFVRGQYPAVSAKANDFESYRLEFSTKIAKGGTGWRVAGGANGGHGAYFMVTADTPDLVTDGVSTWSRNTLVAGYGFSIIQQQILPSAQPRDYPISFPITEGEWYKISTTLNSTGYLVSINDKEVAFVTNDAYGGSVAPGWGSGSFTKGTFGFGPFLNQAAYFKDVNVFDKDGSNIYYNPMTSDDTLGEYAVDTNKNAVCVDGPKRDRAIWIGDFVHTARMLATSSGRYDFIQSMIDFEFAWQLTAGDGAGYVPIQAFLGSAEKYKEVYFPSEYYLRDYQHFFLLTLGDYFALTSNTDFLSKYWNQVKTLVDTLQQDIEPATGLLAKAGATWFLAQGEQHATAPTALYASALAQLVNVATALGDNDTAKLYSDRVSDLNSAINSQLWSSSLNAYGYSLGKLDTSALLATAFTIRAGTADKDRATKSIERLSDLFLQIGYKDTSSSGSGNTVQLSPNTQGFLLEALFHASLKLGVPVETVGPHIKNMTEVFWPKMVTQDEYFTGTSWEYLYPDGSPGIGLFTSLGHPWGGAPTYIYTNYILGVRPEWNNGKYDWVMDPAWDVINYLGIRSAAGRIPLEGGGYITAGWSYGNARSDHPKMSGQVVGNSEVELVVKDDF